MQNVGATKSIPGENQHCRFKKNCLNEKKIWSCCFRFGSFDLLSNQLIENHVVQTNLNIIQSPQELNDLDPVVRNEIFQVFCALLSNPNIVVVQPNQIDRKSLQLFTAPIVLEVAINEWSRFQTLTQEMVENVENARKLRNLQPSKITLEH